MRPSRPVVLLAAAAAVVGLALPAAASPPPAQAPGATVSDAQFAGSAGGRGFAANTVAQIDALAQAKLARTPTQNKIDSRLLAESQLRHGRPVAAGVGRVFTGVKTDSAGLTRVRIAGKVSTGLLARIASVGGRVVGAFPRTSAVAADVPLGAVEALAASPAVTSVSVADQPLVAGVGAAGVAGPAPNTLSKAERLALLRQRVAAALAGGGRSTRAGVVPGRNILAAGSVTSEGDVTHAANTARARFGVSGIGVKVCALSDGVDSLATSIASGDLPPDVQVLPGQAGSGDEGTAILEIIHDLAPKASLEFATANNSIDSFAQNIRDLRTAGCNIILDDIIYFAESPFQDGPIAQAVIDVTNSGALYFSSAGNEGNVDVGTAGNWEGNYRPSGQAIGKFAGIAHNFAPSGPVQTLDPLTPGSSGVPVILQWADPLGHSANDYDLYAVDPSGNVVAFSNNVQNGSQDPFEGFFLPGGGVSYGIAVVKFSGANRYFQVTAFRGRFSTEGGLTGYSTPGATRGHSAVPAAFSVAAAPAHGPLPFSLEPGDPPNPSGPFPGVFTRSQLPERFTSDGPRRVFFNPDGTPITPGNFSATGGTVRMKPDITAADGVVTSLPGFTPFFGTSVAAPHAAAIAALVLSGNPGITPAEVRAALTGTAIDIVKRGWDRDTGFGIVMADRVLAATGATPQPFVRAGAPVVTPVGSPFFQPGGTAKVTVPVTNVGDNTALSVNVQLSTATPGVTITPAVRSYGSLAVGQTKSGTFTVSLAGSYPPGQPIALRIKVSFVGAYSPIVSSARVPTGQPSTVVTTVAYTGPPVPIPDANPAGASVSLPVSGLGLVSHATFSVDGTTCTTAAAATTVGIDHTFFGDLIGTLIAPDGTQVVLWSRIGGSGHNMCQAVFDDAATKAIQSAQSTDAPFTGSWQPKDPMSTLVGTNGDGTWTFHAVDAAAADVGSIRAVSLHLSGYVRPAA